MDDLISRQAAIDAIEEYADRLQMVDWKENPGVPYKAYALNWCINTIRDLPPAQPDLGKYEYHYDHTDCIWYQSEARNRCPATCAQYRDGWNDAMNYIFRDGEGYRPFRRDKKYEG